MDNKKIGLILVSVSIILLVLLLFVRANTIRAYQAEIDRYVDAGLACPSDPNICPHEQRARAQIPIYIAGAILFGVISLGIYIMLFDKSQKEIISTLENQKKIQVGEEKFSILLKGLSDDEKKVISAVKDQDGITQATLRIRTDLHKSKLSIILDSLEKKGLIKREQEKKTKKVYLNMQLLTF